MSSPDPAPDRPVRGSHHASYRVPGSLRGRSGQRPATKLADRESISIVTGACSFDVQLGQQFLIGETIGTFDDPRLSWTAVAVFTLLTLFSYFWVGGMDAFQEWIQPTLSTLLILIIFMVLSGLPLRSATMDWWVCENGPGWWAAIFP